MNSICCGNANLRAQRILIKTSFQLEQKHTGANPTAWDGRCQSAEIQGERAPSTPCRPRNRTPNLQTQGTEQPRLSSALGQAVCETSFKCLHPFVPPSCSVYYTEVMLSVCP